MSESRMRTRTGQEGFTLIELLVVIAIIAILMIANVVRGLLGGGSAGTETTDPPANSPYKNEGYQAPPADMSPPELPILERSLSVRSGEIVCQVTPPSRVRCTYCDP